MRGSDFIRLLGECEVERNNYSRDEVILMEIYDIKNREKFVNEENGTINTYKMTYEPFRIVSASARVYDKIIKGSIKTDDAIWVQFDTPNMEFFSISNRGIVGEKRYEDPIDIREKGNLIKRVRMPYEFVESIESNVLKLDK